jgi:hypothetical protein
MNSIRSDFDEVAFECEGCKGDGIRCPAGPSCDLPEIEGTDWVVVEKCDTCDRFPDDLSAAGAVFATVKWVRCSTGGRHAVGKDPLNRSDRQHHIP